MKKIYELLAMFAMMGIDAPENISHKQIKLNPEEIEELKNLRTAGILKRKLNRGLKEWTFNNITVIALNKKNALRKINNIKILLNS